MLLHAGQLVFSGPAAVCAKYIQQHTCSHVSDDMIPDISNPVEFVLKIMVSLPLESSESSNEPSVAKLVQLMNQQFTTSTTDTPRHAEYSYDDDSVTGTGLGGDIWVDFWPLLYVQIQREILQETRRLRYWLACFVRSVFLGSVLGAYVYDMW